MIKFDSKTKIIISDNLSDDVDTLLNDENVSDVGLIVDTNVCEVESIKSLKTFLDKKHKLRYKEIKVTEPTMDMVNHYADKFRKNPPELLIGIGGGSTLDLVKAISVMSIHDGVVEDYHGTGKPFTQGIRKILIPTTAGTGAEVTKGAVLVNEKTKFKRAISGKHITADYALLYAELTTTMPDNITATTGLDALAHAIESYTAKCANEITRMYSLKAFSLIFNNLPKIFEYKNNLEYRKNVLLGSCLAGYAIYNSDTGACHAMSYPLGIYNHVPHGLAVGTLLPKVIANNIEKGASQYANLYDAIDEVLFLENIDEKSHAFLHMINSFKPLQYMGKTFRDYGINESNIDFLSERGLDLKSALNNNPVEFTLKDSISIYQQVMKESVNMDLANITTIFFDFDGIFTDNSVYMDQNGVETIRCSRADGLGIKLLHREHIRMAIVSAEENLVVSSRASKLNLPVFQGCHNKVAFFKDYLKKENINPDYTAFIGNDINDLEAMLFFKYRVCPADSHPDILACANIKLNASGGNGAVREFCEMIISSRQKTS